MHRLTVQYFAPSDPAAFDEAYESRHVPLVRDLPGLKSFTLTRPRALGGDAPHLARWRPSGIPSRFPTGSAGLW